MPLPITTTAVQTLYYSLAIEFRNHILIPNPNPIRTPTPIQLVEPQSTQPNPTLLPILDPPRLLPLLSPSLPCPSFASHLLSFLPASCDDIATGLNPGLIRH